MAQTGFTPIQLYSTSTAAAAPVAGNLTNSTLGSELAINITDGKLFYKDNANAVQVIGWKTVPTTAGGTGLTTYTAGDLSYYATGTTFTKLAIGTTGQILTSTGSAPQWSTLSGVAVTTFSAGTTGFTPNSATSGAVTLAGTLITSNGGTGLSSYAQGDLLYYNSGTTLTALAKNTAATRYLSNTGSNNNPAWAQIDLTNGVTGDLPYSNLAQGSALSVLGVTGNATADVANIAAGTDHQVLRRSGTSLAFGAVALNQSAAITGTLPVGNGGTGTSTAFTAGSVLFAGASGVYSQNNANLFWDNSNTRLGISTNTPSQKLHVVGNVLVTPATWGSSGTGAVYLGDTNNYVSATFGGDMDVVGFGAISFKNVSGGLTERMRITAAGDVTVSTGNLVIGTSGKGIDFSATAGTGTSELLADYEEGTWTPTITTSSGTITSYTSSGYYTKIGRQVTLNGLFTITNIGTGTGSIGISNLPFSIANAVAGGTARESAVNGLGSVIYQNSSTELFMRTAANGDPGATNASFQFSVTYFN
jgi:hypothetical protein